jgi:hypothetical protein
VAVGPVLWCGSATPEEAAEQLRQADVKPVIPHVEMLELPNELALDEASRCGRTLSCVQVWEQAPGARFPLITLKPTHLELPDHPELRVLTSLPPIQARRCDDADAFKLTTDRRNFTLPFQTAS